LTLGLRRDTKWNDFPFYGQVIFCLFAGEKDVQQPQGNHEAVE
jgi:hypothetical protein